MLLATFCRHIMDDSYNFCCLTSVTCCVSYSSTYLTNDAKLITQLGTWHFNWPQVLPREGHRQRYKYRSSKWLSFIKAASKNRLYRSTKMKHMPEIIMMYRNKCGSMLRWYNEIYSQQENSNDSSTRASSSSG